MAQVLYRKYRSKKLSEIVGQEHITKSLSEALKSGRLSHAYLFTGPRGVGKTSVARILAHEVNGIPYNDDQPHIDIIEIDAASNRRIDEIRDLRDKVHISPASAKYKVYIIDEVHMLTKEAFNALLKTLEEPPAHVIFILATTDPHKLPDTIISRTQRFSFKPIDNNNAVEHLKLIAKEEKIKVTDEALKLIAIHGEGSFRDSISLLDQLSSGSKEITAEDVRSMLGIPSSEAIDNLVKLIENPTTSYKQLSNELYQLYDLGYSPSLLAKNLMNVISNKLVDGQLKITDVQAINLLKQLLEVDAAADPNSYLLLTLMESLSPANIETVAKVKPAEETASTPDPTPSKIEDIKAKNTKILPANEAIWPEVLNELKNRYNTLYGIVRMAEPVFKENNQLDLLFEFPFHKKQVSEAKNKQLIASVISDLTNENYHIECYVSDKVKPSSKETSSTTEPKNKDLENISKIFGGGELVD